MKKIVIIGATSGLGRELTKLYIAKGWKIGIAGRREEVLKEIKEKHPNQIEYEVIDITNPESPDALINLVEKLGGMDIYFHSSGIGYQNRRLKPEIELNTVQTNVYGFTLMVNAAFRYFRKHKKGHIAVISSVAGTRGMGAAPAYSATKRFQYTYIDALEQQSYINKHNITFTDIRPGFVQTELLKGGGSYPMLMKPANVAKAIVRALDHKKRRVVIDWKYKVLVFLWKLIPSFLWKRINLKQ